MLKLRKIVFSGFWSLKLKSVTYRLKTDWLTDHGLLVLELLSQHKAPRCVIGCVRCGEDEYHHSLPQWELPGDLHRHHRGHVQVRVNMSHHAAHNHSRTLIKGKEGNVILEITDTTGSHQFPAMRRLSVVRGNHQMSENVNTTNLTFRPCFRSGVQHLLQAESHGAQADHRAYQRNQRDDGRHPGQCKTEVWQWLTSCAVSSWCWWATRMTRPPGPGRSPTLQARLYRSHFVLIILIQKIKYYCTIISFLNRLIPRPHIRHHLFLNKRLNNI